MNRFKLYGKVWPLLLLLLLLPTQGESAPKVGDRFGAWTFSCKAMGPGKTRCGLIQQVQTRRSGKTILYATLGYAGKGGRLVLMLRTPLNIYLPTGVQVGIDSGPLQSAPLQQCKKKGCVALLKISNTLLEAFYSGTQMRVVFRVILKEGVVAVPVKLMLNGLKNGILALEGSDRKENRIYREKETESLVF
ncbi:MAG: invasion associated locus B family protein [Magnetococcales bacterium]|nr:invasion associated locus B family protein [Magnetococcales bacterium]